MTHLPIMGRGLVSTRPRMGVYFFRFRFLDFGAAPCTARLGDGRAALLSPIHQRLLMFTVPSPDVAFNESAELAKRVTWGTAERWRNTPGKRLILPPMQRLSGFQNGLIAVYARILAPPTPGERQNSRRATRCCHTQSVGVTTSSITRANNTVVSSAPVSSTPKKRPIPPVTTMAVSRRKRRR